MSTQQQNPDGSWSPAKPLGYQPGYDIERYDDHWELHRTTRTSSAEVARGRSTLRLLATYTWFRFIRPIKEDGS